jgi:hypothetical protein
MLILIGVVAAFPCFRLEDSRSGLARAGIRSVRRRRFLHQPYAAAAPGEPALFDGRTRFMASFVLAHGWNPADAVAGR